MGCVRRLLQGQDILVEFRMPPARVQCEFCGKTFSKRANLNRHFNSNSCTARPNPDTVRPRCQFCNGRFKSQRVLNQHLSRKRCTVKRSQPRELQEQNGSPQHSNAAHTTAAASESTAATSSIAARVVIHDTATTNWVANKLSCHKRRASRSESYAVRHGHGGHNGAPPPG